MRPIARVMFDESHRQAWSVRPEVAAQMSPANPADSGYVQAAALLQRQGFPVTVHAEGPLTEEVLAATDVLVVPHCSQDEWEATTAPTEHLSDRSWDARHVQAATKASTTCPNERANASRS